MMTMEGMTQKHFQHRVPKEAERGVCGMVEFVAFIFGKEIVELPKQPIFVRMNGGHHGFWGNWIQESDSAVWR